MERRLGMVWIRIRQGSLHFTSFSPPHTTITITTTTTAIAVYPNCLLFAKAEYPFPAMGSVHVSNFTKIYRPLPVDEDYPAEIKVRASVRVACVRIRSESP